MESPKWSNLVCTHKADAIAVLDGIAQEGEARRRRECTRSGAAFANGNDAERRESVVRAAVEAGGGERVD